VTPPSKSGSTAKSLKSKNMIGQTVILAKIEPPSVNSTEYGVQSNINLFVLFSLIQVTVLTTSGGFEAFYTG
jgi:hypothetical protein